MNHDAYPDAYIADVLLSVKTIAAVGASANAARPSYLVVKYLLAKGYMVHPVNPGLGGPGLGGPGLGGPGLGGQVLLGRKVYARLGDVPAPVDMVDVFRNSEAALDVTRDAIALKDKLDIKVVWMQLGVRNDQAAAEAEAAGLQVIMNRCPKIEYGRLSGEIGWFGINSGRLSSHRPLLSPGGVQGLSIGKKS